MWIFHCLLSKQFIFYLQCNNVGECVVSAIRAGYRHIDCAYGYDNEAQVAEGLKKSFEAGLVKREELFITSKVSCLLFMKNYLALSQNTNITWFPLRKSSLKRIHFSSIG